MSINSFKEEIKYQEWKLKEMIIIKREREGKEIEYLSEESELGFVEHFLLPEKFLKDIYKDNNREHSLDLINNYIIKITLMTSMEKINKGGPRGKARAILKKSDAILKILDKIANHDFKNINKKIISTMRNKSDELRLKLNKPDNSYHQKGKNTEQ